MHLALLARGGTTPEPVRKFGVLAQHPHGHAPLKGDRIFVLRFVSLDDFDQHEMEDYLILKINPRLAKAILFTDLSLIFTSPVVVVIAHTRPNDCRNSPS